MPTKARKKTPKRTVARSKAAGKKVSQKTQAPTLPDAASSDAASARFVQDLMVRGDAAERSKTGSVPRHASHVIKRKNSDGSVEVERVRFKAF